MEPLFQTSKILKLIVKSFKEVRLSIGINLSVRPPVGDLYDASRLKISTSNLLIFSFFIDSWMSAPSGAFAIKQNKA